MRFCLPSLFSLALVSGLGCSGAAPLAAADANGSTPPASSSPVPAAEGSYREASISDLASKLGSVKLLDVRSQGEFDRGHVAGAVLLPVSELPGRLAELQDWLGEEVWVICQSGGRSAKAGHLLQGEGFDVVNVRGGTGAWIAAGKPVE